MEALLFYETMWHREPYLNSFECDLAMPLVTTNVIFETALKNSGKHTTMRSETPAESHALALLNQLLLTQTNAQKPNPKARSVGKRRG